MALSRKSAKIPRERMTLTKLGTLMEAQGKTSQVVAEGVRGLRAEFGTFKMALEDVDERLQRVEPVVNILAKVDERLQRVEPVVNILAKRVESVANTLAPLPARIDTIDERLERIEKRLEFAEAKLPS